MNEPRYTSFFSSGTIEIRTLGLDDCDAWDRFVETCDGGTFFHLSGWKRVIEHVFEHEAFYLYAKRNGNIEGVVPLVRVHSRLFGDALCSTPFCVYGGILALSDEVGAALEREAIRVAEGLNVDHLELRERSQVRPGWKCKDLYVTFRREISADHDENMKNIPRKQRAMVRKGIGNGLSSTSEEGVNEVFDAYARSLHALGTPVLPRRYFKALKDVFGDKCECMVIRKDNMVVAGVMSFVFRDEIIPYYGGGTAAARELKANDFMYWSVMVRAADAGLRVFDYGRSRIDSGSYHFKRNWGFEPQPLFYQFHLVNAHDLPNLSPNNARYHMLIQAWKRLPYSMTRVIGPPLAKYLG